MAEGNDKPTDGADGADGRRAAPEARAAGLLRGRVDDAPHGLHGRRPGASAALAGAAIVLPGVGFALAPIFERGKERWEAVGPPGDFVADTYTPVVVHRSSRAIGEAGKTTAYMRKGNPELLERGPEASFVAISTRCAHLGCPVRFVEAAGNFICPCHGGVYDFQGKVIGGPPVRPLDRFQTRVRTARSRSARATASPPSSSRSAPATPASSPAASGSTSTRRGPSVPPPP